MAQAVRTEEMLSGKTFGASAACILDQYGSHASETRGDEREAPTRSTPTTRGQRVRRAFWAASALRGRAQARVNVAFTDIRSETDDEDEGSSARKTP